MAGRRRDPDAPTDCMVCGAGPRDDSYRQDRCPGCYTHWKRHGTDRPQPVRIPAHAIYVGPPGTEDLALGADPASMYDYDLADFMAARPPWQLDALCREPSYRHINWFPERGEDTSPAKAVCARCAVQQDCADYAQSLGGGLAIPGIWGGLSGRERRGRRAGAA